MKYIQLLILLALTSNLFGQTIRLDFPHFAGQEYTFGLFNGDIKDTIVVGRLDKSGKAVLAIPSKYESYRGIGQWMLAQGGGLDLVIANENFTVSSSDAQPNESNIIYKNSPENEFFINQFIRQQKLFNKADAMYKAIQAYGADDNLSPVFNKELDKLKSEFDNMQVEISQSSLYAARFREIDNFLMGVGRHLSYPSEQDKLNDLRDFAAHKLDLEALYTSYKWNDLLNSWMEMHLEAVKNDSLLFDDTQDMLKRINSEEVYTAFAEKIVGLFSKYGKDPLLVELGADFKQSGKLQSPSTYLQRLTSAQKGDVAPALIGLENTPFTGKQTIIVFHESGCGNCEYEMNQFKGKYTALQEKGIQLISVSADTDKAIFETKVNSFPWTNKLCDLKGFQGQNFINYGVMGTPTIIVIDKNGIVSGRYARLIDTGLLPN